MYVNQTMPLYFEEEGKGKSIVFVHPPGMGLVTFKKQQPLSESFRFITFDLRGNGKSGNTNERITIPLLASDIVHLLDHLGIEKTVICGYSNGGSIALEFALSHPERIEGLILIGGFPEVNTWLLRAEFLLGIYAAKLKMIPLIAKAIGTAHGESKSFKQELDQYFRLTNPEILHQMYAEGLKYNCTKRLQTLKVPLLLVYGAKDHYVHSYQKLFQQYVKQTDIVFISKSRHQIPTKFHNELNRVIKDFMLSLEKSTNE
jgi:pimeloyl-ACP methyl ester carboxylesterase